MLTHTTTDNQVDILLSMFYDDLENYCFTEKRINHLCRHDHRIQQRLQEVHERVNDTIKGIKFDESVLFVLNDDINNILSILSKYKIRLDLFSYPPKNNESWYYMKVSMKFNGIYDITFSKYFKNTRATYKFTTEDITLKQLKLFLFHLYYDNII
jgi:hypothetical protein